MESEITNNLNLDGSVMILYEGKSFCYALFLDTDGTLSTLTEHAGSTLGACGHVLRLWPLWPQTLQQ